jgi:hypothetical protein
MIHQTTVEEDYENPIASSLITNQRTSQTQLLTRIYYPDTLYPDNYSFFADRGDTASSQIKSPLPMDPSDQYPTTDTSDRPAIISTLSRQPTTEIEIIDRPNKYVVSISFTNFFYWFILFFSILCICLKNEENVVFRH